MLFRSKVQPKMLVEFDKEYSDDTFIGIFRGHKILCHKDYWKEVSKDV